MKKILLTFITLSCFVPVAHAAPKPPSLLEPHKNDNFAIKKPITFSWTKISGATKYRLIISKDPKFTNYDVAKDKCAANSAKSCFSYRTAALKYPVPAKTPFLQEKGTFYWQVQAIGATGSSTVFRGNNLNNTNAGEVRPFSMSDTLAIPKIKGDGVAVSPSVVNLGENVTFSVTLTTELLDGYQVKIELGDGEYLDMKGAGVSYSYSTQAQNVGEDQSFTIVIFDANGEEVDSLGSLFTVVESGAVTPPPVVTPPVITPPVVVTPPVVTPPPVTVPSVSSVDVAPKSVVRGNPVTFSANLSGTLPTGYSVKVDYGNGLFAMSGNGSNYSFSASPVSSAAYSIGIYDAKNTLKSNQPTGNFSVTEPNAAPTLSLISGATSATISTPYITQLSASDSNLSLIFIDWGDGASESKNATSGANVSFSHNYTSAGNFTWSATAYDSQDATSTAVSKTVTVAKAPVVVTPPVVSKTTGYTKIANNGSVLSDDAKLGTAPTDWACTKDNKTGLIWEVKTTDGGLRDWKSYYSWYKPDGDNGGYAGYQNGNGHPEWCKGSDCDTYAFTNAVNAQGLCGAKDWRMPTIDELKGLLTKTSQTNQPQNEKLYIDPIYFPNTKYWFWSSSPNANGSGNAWIVGFGYGDADDGVKNYYNNVRLVR